MQTELVGLTGFAGCGKDATFHALASECDGALRFAFADALKREVAEVRECTVEELEASKGEPAVRNLLQRWGMMRRQQREDYWVQQVAAQIKALRPRVAIITDVRFANEIDWLRRQGGVLARVERPGVGPVNDHVSEFEWQQFAPDYVIRNDGGLDALAHRAREFWAWWEQRHGQ